MVACGLSQPLKAAEGDAARISKLMRALGGMFTTAGDSYGAWPACPNNYLGPVSPSDEYYQDFEDAPDELAYLVDQLRYAYLIGLYSYTIKPGANVEGATTVPLTQWDDIPPVIRDAPWPLTGETYGDVLAALESAVQKIKYIEIPSSRISQIARGINKARKHFGISDTPTRLPAEGRDAITSGYGGADWEDKPDTEAGSHSCWTYLDIAGSFVWNGGATAFRQEIAIDSTELGGTIQLFSKAQALGGADAPIPADGKLHEWTSIGSGQNVEIPMPGSFDIGFAPDMTASKNPNSWGWELGWPAFILEVMPDTTPDAATCCNGCTTSSCRAGDVNTSLNSARVAISFGQDGATYAGQAVLYSRQKNAKIADPSLLRWHVNGEYRYNAGWAVKQVRTLGALADLVVLSPTKYEIRFYDNDHVGVENAWPFYVPVEPAYKVVTIEDPQGTGESLKVTEQEGQMTRVNQFLWDDAAGEWSLEKDLGGYTETIRNEWNAGHTAKTQIQEIKDGNGATILVNHDVFAVFPWGQERVLNVKDPNGAAETASWEFYDNEAMDGSAYGRLKMAVDASGSWERYTYDANGRLYQKVKPFQNSPPTAPLEQCRVETHSHSPDGRTETVVETVLGVEVSRRYEVSDVGGYVTKSITCVHPGAAVDDESNLVTITRYTWSATGRRVYSVLQPTGHLTTYAYWVDEQGVATATVERGQADGAGTSVIDGQRTVTVTGASGGLLSETVSSIPGNLILSSATATAWNGHGNPTHIDYDDGTSEHTEYVGCCGQAGSRTDREGITTGYTYDAHGNVETETRAGITWTYTTDALGRRTKTEQAGGASTRTLEENHYNLAGELEWTKDALNRQTTFSETINNGRLEKTTTYPDLTTRIETYNIDGTLYTVAGTAAHPLKYEYGVDADGLFTKEIRVGDGGAETEWVKTYRDFAGRPSKTVYPGGAFSQSFYNPVGQLVKEIDPDGVRTLYTYNGKGEREKTVLDFNRDDVIDDAGPDRVTQTVSSVTTRGAKTVHRTVTSMSGPNPGDGLAVVAEVDQTPNGRESWQTHFGRLTTQVTTLQPANASRTEVVTRPDLTTEVTQYDLGRPAWVEQRNQNGTKLTKTAFDYDDYGRLHTATDDRNGATVHTYTDLDEILTVTTPPPEAGQAGLTTTREYQPLSRRLDWVQLPDGSKQYTTYWPTGELKKSWGSQTYTTEYTYDAQGRMKTLTTTGAAGPAVTTWTYSPTRGWLTAKTYEGGNGTTYPEYTPAGRLKQRQWQRGITTTYEYNNAGEREKIVYSGGAAHDVTYGYDRRGRQTSVIDGTGTRTLSYTSDGQLEDEVYTQGTLAGLGTMRDYDGTGRRQTLTVQTLGNSLASSYGYDLGGRLETITSGQHAVAYGYEPNSPLLKTTTSKRNGTTVMTATRSYDKNNRLTGITTARPTTGVIASYGYQLNSLGQRDRADLADGSAWHYTYDTLGQVTNGKRYWSDTTEVAGQQFSYLFDGIGNRTSTTTNGRAATYTPNVLNQYSERTVPGAVDVLGEAAPGATVTVNTTATARKNGYYYNELPVSNSAAPVYASVNVHAEASGQTMDQTGHVFVPKAVEVFSHDLDGNQTGDGRWTYTWDAENRLIAVETKAEAVTAGAPKQRLEFDYDDRWRRVSKKVFGWNTTNNDWELASEIRFLYDGWNLVAELGGSNNLLRSYVWGLDLSQTIEGAGGVGGLVSETNYPATGSASYFPVYEGNGNIVSLIKTTDGYPRAQYEYGPFGETIRESGMLSESNPFRFSTKYQDLDTAHLYYGYRFLATAEGRWLSRDPINENGGHNLYGFASNNPVSKVDFLGRFVVDSETAHRYPKFAALISSAETHLTYEGYQSIRRWGMVCPVDLKKSRKFILNLYSSGSGPTVSAHRYEKGSSTQAEYKNKNLIYFSEYWVRAFEGGYITDGERRIIAKLGHEVVHLVEFGYSADDRKLAKYTWVGSDGTRDRSGYRHPAKMFELDTYGRSADFGFIPEVQGKTHELGLE